MFSPAATLLCAVLLLSLVARVVVVLLLVAVSSLTFLHALDASEKRR